MHGFLVAVTMMCGQVTLRLGITALPATFELESPKWFVWSQLRGQDYIVSLARHVLSVELEGRTELAEQKSIGWQG